MKRTLSLAILLFVLFGTASKAQTIFKEYKTGHPIYISLPDYLSKTAGLNNSASIQYKSVVKDIYGFVIEDNKEEMALVEMKYASITEFYDDFIKGFTKEMEKPLVGTPVSQKKGEISFTEVDLSYYDAEAKAEIYYLVGIVETKTSYYKILTWCTADNKAAFKADFQKILYSFHD